MNNIKSLIDTVIEPYVDTWNCLLRHSLRHYNASQAAQMAQDRIEELSNEIQDHERALNDLNHRHGLLCADLANTRLEKEKTIKIEPVNFDQLNNKRLNLERCNESQQEIENAIQNISSKMRSIESKKSDAQSAKWLYELDDCELYGVSLRRFTHYSTLVVSSVSLARAIALSAATCFAALSAAAFFSTSGFTAIVLTGSLAAFALIFHDVYWITKLVQDVLTKPTLLGFARDGGIESIKTFVPYVMTSFYEACNTTPLQMNVYRYGISLIQTTGRKMQQKFERNGKGDGGWLALNQAFKTIEKNTILIHFIYRTFAHPKIESLIKSEMNKA